MLAGDLGQLGQVLEAVQRWGQRQETASNGHLRGYGPLKMESLGLPQIPDLNEYYEKDRTQKDFKERNGGPERDNLSKVIRW